MSLLSPSPAPPWAEMNKGCSRSSSYTRQHKLSETVNRTIRIHTVATATVTARRSDPPVAARYLWNVAEMMMTCPQETELTNVTRQETGASLSCLHTRNASLVEQEGRSCSWSGHLPPPRELERVQGPELLQGEKVAISREILCHSSLVCFPLFRFCSTSLNCIIPTGVRQKALRALRMIFTKSS